MILTTLHANTAALRGHGVKGLVVFGPTARNENCSGCPVDFLLEMDPPHTFDHFLEIKLFLKALLARPVELVIASPQHPEIRPYVEPDAIYIL
jgi:uncharacterized protein